MRDKGYESGDMRMGKYNLHNLGWKNFENLVCTIMQHVLGITFTPFSEGMDGGRDGFYWGAAKEGLFTDASLQGKFAFQCKHTSKLQESFSFSVVKNELPKVRKLVDEQAIEHYIIFTNLKVSALSEAETKKKFLEIKGIQTCIVLGEEWFDNTIDTNPILRRLVPRLYGIGDLSQILDERAREQSHAELELFQINVTTFVSTRAYQDALTALDQHGFVVLLGPPSVGKTSIAATICMTSKVENDIDEVYVFNRAEQFETHWNPSETNCLYWIDDVFGVTSLEHRAFIDWMRVFRKLNAAITKGNKIIFTSRNYIFSEARETIKQGDFPLLFHSQVIINVADLTPMEKTMILYNHIKCGNLSKVRKTELKPFLIDVASHSSFTPEMARRLGSTFFSSSLKISKEGVQHFFEHPTSYFEDVISTLNTREKAALVLILLHNNLLPSPVADDSFLACIMSAYPVKLSEIRHALDYMHGDLVKHVRQSNQIYWSLHHPSMIDSLLHILSSRIEMVELYLRGADFNTVITNTTCRDDTQHKIFIPQSLWPLLIEKLSKQPQEWITADNLAYYVNLEGSDVFLHWLQSAHKSFLLRIVKPLVLDIENKVCWSLSARLLKLDILDEGVHSQLIDIIKQHAKEWGDFSFVSNPDLLYILGEEEVDHLKQFLYIMGRDWFSYVIKKIGDYSEEEWSPGDLEKLFETATLYESILQLDKTWSDMDIEDELEYIFNLIEKSKTKHIRNNAKKIWDYYPISDYSYQSHSTELTPVKVTQFDCFFEDVDQ
ncbi:hypothetical protein [Paenibacillus phytohabitans]|uniref:nSTAND3 domain-containing NTPase n=1 Tax=Paenibacillus phytohabitans TaxID=2654978 RepID=UPI00300A0D64